MRSTRSGRMAPKVGGRRRTEAQPQVPVATGPAADVGFAPPARQLFREQAVWRHRAGAVAVLAEQLHNSSVDHHLDEPRAPADPAPGSSWTFDYGDRTVQNSEVPRPAAVRLTNQASTG
jgi:hypothetical protein